MVDLPVPSGPIKAIVITIIVKFILVMSNMGEPLRTTLGSRMDMGDKQHMFFICHHLCKYPPLDFFCLVNKRV